METPTTPRSTLNPPVFYTSAALILALVLFTVLLQEEAQSLFNRSSNGSSPTPAGSTYWPWR